jgi:hypothetical protein
VICTVTVGMNGGEVTRLSAYGDHPYAAINRAVDRLRPGAVLVRRRAAVRPGLYAARRPG